MGSFCRYTLLPYSKTPSFSSTYYSTSLLSSRPRAAHCYHASPNRLVGRGAPSLGGIPIRLGRARPVRRANFYRNQRLIGGVICLLFGVGYGSKAVGVLYRSIQLVIDWSWRGAQPGRPVRAAIGFKSLATRSECRITPVPTIFIKIIGL